MQADNDGFRPLHDVCIWDLSTLSWMVACNFVPTVEGMEHVVFHHESSHSLVTSGHSPHFGIIHISNPGQFYTPVSPRPPAPVAV